MDIVLLIASLAIILVAAELFTNGIEWFGHKLNLAEGAVGSVLAAVATAMPETLIPVIAILGPVLLGGTATESSSAVGVGAILGAPFMLSTLAMFVTGTAVVIYSRRGRRTTDMRVNTRVLGRDVGFFIVGYGVAIGTAFLPQEVAWLKWVAAGFLFILYAVYVRLHFTDTPEEAEGGGHLTPLHLTRVPALSGPRMLEIDVFHGAHSLTGGEPRMGIVVAQVIVALGLIIVGAQVFVGAVEHLSTVIGLDPTILALIIAPIATELPEKFNSVLWVRNGKDTLAMGNITGAMVFQSCLPTVLGLLFTTWTFTGASAISFASAGV
ncbi:MAG: sodium:calcium antiporter, partial [Chloroflexota bacterium]